MSTALRWRRAAALGPVFALVVACGNKAPDGARAVASASASSAARASAPPPPPPSVASPPVALPTDPLCRALRVEGDAKLGESALGSGMTIDGSEWVSLAKGASLTLKHARSGREVSLMGPALFRACRRGREQVLLASGKLAAGSGMGSRPGAEVLIATPVGAVRYGDADFTLTLDDKKLSVEVRAGQVDVDSATSKQLKSPLHAKDKLVVPLGKPDVVSLMARCKAAAEQAETSARRVGDRSAPEPLGERAKAHVEARKAARVACTIAAAATGLVADPAARDGFWAEAARWEGLWESIPRPSHSQAPEK